METRKGGDGKKMRVPVHAPCGTLPRTLSGPRAEVLPAFLCTHRVRFKDGSLVDLLSHREYLCGDARRRFASFAGELPAIIRNSCSANFTLSNCVVTRASASRSTEDANERSCNRGDDGRGGGLERGMN